MTGLVLDTHAFIWWVADDKRLSPRAQEAIASTEHVYVSAASAWEIATKTRIGKLRTEPDLSKSFAEVVSEHGFFHLPVHHRHATTAGSFTVAHRDPFDRMIAAQAMLEGYQLVTRDPSFADFDTDTIW